MSYANIGTAVWDVAIFGIDGDSLEIHRWRSLVSDIARGVENTTPSVCKNSFYKNKIELQILWKKLNL